MTVCDGTTTKNFTGGHDDGSNNSLASPRVAEAAVFNGIGRMQTMNLVTTEVALRRGDGAQSFMFA